MKRNTPSWRASRVKRNGGYLRAALAVACYALPGISSAGALECTQWQSRHPGWLWCDDFESDRDLENNYFEVNRAKGRLAVVAGPAYGGTHSLRNGYVTGMEEAGNIKLSIGKTPLHPMRYTDRNFDDLYWRFYLMTDAGWVGQPMKVTRATIIAGPNWSQAAIGHLWEDDRLGLGLDPASGVVGSTVVTTGWNDFPRLHWLGKANGRTQVYAPGNRGRWQCIEVHMQLNRPGRADGTFEFWVDGVPQAKKDNLDWRGDYTAYGINTITLEGWVNGGAPRDQNRYFDNFVVSTARIGCARS
jgi:hypothetical protein